MQGEESKISEYFFCRFHPGSDGPAGTPHDAPPDAALVAATKLVASTKLVAETFKHGHKCAQDRCQK